MKRAAIERVVAEARRTGARTHLLHLSSAEALPDLRAARAAGVDLSVETCPHYLVLAAVDVPDGGTEFKCCPPIRDADNRDALWRGRSDGDIHPVVSDHSPSTPDLKRALGGVGHRDSGLADQVGDFEVGKPFEALWLRPAAGSTLDWGFGTLRGRTSPWPRRSTRACPPTWPRLGWAGAPSLPPRHRRLG